MTNRIYFAFCYQPCDHLENYQIYPLLEAFMKLFSSVHFQMSQKCSSQVFIFESVKSIKGRPVAIAGGMCYVFIWQMVLSGKMGRSNKKG